MKKISFILIIIVMTQITIITKASNWQYKINNRIANDIAYIDDNIFLISKTLQLSTSFNGQSINKNTYSISKLDQSGNEISSVNFTALETLKGVLSNENDALYLVMESSDVAGKKISIKQFDTNLKLTRQTKYNIPESLDFTKFDYDENALFLLGKDESTDLLQVTKIDNLLKTVWSKQIGVYPADISLTNQNSYDLKVAGQHIYVIYNTSRVIQKFTLTPSNKNFTGVAVQLNDLGQLNWAKKIQYDHTNFLRSNVHTILKANQNGVWFTGTVNPRCFEGCPKNLVYNMNTDGDIVQYSTISPSFYNYVSDGFALADGSMIIHGYSTGDVFGPLTPYSKSHLIILNNLMTPVQSYSSDITEIDHALLGQGESVFKKIIALNNNEILILNKQNTITKVALDNPVCTDFAPHNDSVANLSFPGTNNILPSTKKVENFSPLFAFLFRKLNTTLNLTNLCFVADNNKTGLIEQRLAVYPNPSTGKFYLDIELDKEVAYTLQNVEGRIVKKGTLTSNVIDLTTLRVGMYYLKLLDDKMDVPPFKIIKQ